MYMFIHTQLVLIHQGVTELQYLLLKQLQLQLYTAKSQY